MQPEILNRMKHFAGMNRFKKEALRVSNRLGHNQVEPWVEQDKNTTADLARPSGRMLMLSIIGLGGSTAATVGPCRPGGPKPA